MAWPSESSLGGLTLSPMVRWPSTRRRPPAPTVDSTRTSSPRGMHIAHGRRDRRLGQRLGRVPLAGAQDHVEAPFAVEVLAHEHAVAERAHHRADVAARPAHFVEAAIVGVQAQLRLGHFQALEGLHLRAGHLFLDELFGMARRRQQAPESRWPGAGNRCCGRRRSRRTGCPAWRTTGCPESRPASLR